MFDLREHFAPGFLKGLVDQYQLEVEYDLEMSIMRLRNCTLDDNAAWELLAFPLAFALHRLASSKDNPAVSHRNFHALTAAIARPVNSSGELVILIGWNNSPFKGAQRRCAERMVANRALYLDLVIFGAVTVIETQIDDVTGIASDSGLRLSCDDCRWELPEHFGWPEDVWMLFADIRQPEKVREEIIFGAIVEKHSAVDKKVKRKALERSSDGPRH